MGGSILTTRSVIGHLPFSAFGSEPVALAVWCPSRKQWARWNVVWPDSHSKWGKSEEMTWRFTSYTFQKAIGNSAEPFWQHEESFCHCKSLQRYAGVHLTDGTVQETAKFNIHSNEHKIFTNWHYVTKKKKVPNSFGGWFEQISGWCWRHNKAANSYAEQSFRFWTLMCRV